MMFRVELEKSLGIPGCRNPFRMQLNPDDKIRVSVRVWEFEAADEAEVRRLYDEAKKNDFPQLRGYKLRAIIPMAEAEKEAKVIVNVSDTNNEWNKEALGIARKAKEPKS